jgi:copper oxidase (laccase) domain-containing protein
MKIYQTDLACVIFGSKTDSLKNLEKLCERPIVFGHQVHEAELLLVNEDLKRSCCLVTSSDGLWTSSNQIALGIVTADCVPCVIATSESLYSLHLGWRGIHKGLLRKALSKIKTKDQLEVFIGPHIHFESFEVQEDFINNFKSLYPDEEIWSKKTSKGYHVSLLELIKLDLSLSKVDYTLHIDDVDTYTSDKHFSYRGNNKTSERNITCSFLKT